MISNGGDYFNLSNGLPLTMGGTSHCLEKEFYIHEEVAKASGSSTYQEDFNIISEGMVGCGPLNAPDRKLQLACRPISNQMISNAIVGGKDGFGPYNVYIGHSQIGAFLRPPLNPITFELFGLNSLAHHGNEVMVMPNFQSMDLVHSIQLASVRSISRAQEKGIEVFPICSNLNFIAKIGDLATMVKRFKHVYPKEFGSQLNLTEEDTPKKTDASNLLSLDDDSDQDEEIEDILGHNPLCVPSAVERMDPVIGNISSRNIFPTVDFDYLAHISLTEEEVWSQVSESEVKLGDSS